VPLPGAYPAKYVRPKGGPVPVFETLGWGGPRRGPGGNPLPVRH
jgi:hypothetical protein